MSVAAYSPVFYAARGDRIILYIDESNNECFPNRKNTFICGASGAAAGSTLILKHVRDGNSSMGEYKIAVLQHINDADRTVEFIQFEDGVGAMVEIYKNNYIFNDCIYSAAPLDYTIFSKNDNDNYYYERVIMREIVKTRTLDCFITLYSDLYNIQCAVETDAVVSVPLCSTSAAEWISV